MTLQLLRMPYEENLILFFIVVAEDTQPNLVSRILVFSISDIRQERRPRINKVLYTFRSYIFLGTYVGRKYSRVKRFLTLWWSRFWEWTISDSRKKKIFLFLHLSSSNSILISIEKRRMRWWFKSIENVSISERCLRIYFALNWS
jgi:hypothetical protein